MASILIAYASMSGNTEEIADHLRNELEKLGHDITQEEIEDIEPDDLAQYDALLMGSYTWGDGDLPYEVEDFYEEMEDVDLTGIQAAAFGSGDTSYPKFCEAVHLFENQLSNCGATIVQKGFKMEMALNSDEDYEACTAFAKEFANHLNQELFKAQ